MKHILYTIFVSFLIISNLTAQCPLENKVEYLHVNNVRAAILNRGDNFWDLERARFQVPYKGPETPSTIFSAGLWFGGKDIAGNLKLATIEYRNNSSCGYTPGPVRWDYKYDLETARNWNKIFKVYGEEIIAHKQDFKDGQIDDTIPNIFGWPARGNPFFEQIHGFEITDRIQGMADFNDRNENGIYEPHLGDYPRIRGRFWHESYNAIPPAIFWSVYHTTNTNSYSFEQSSIDLEIQQTSWAMSCGDELLDNTIFTRYMIFSNNISTLLNYKVGLWLDPDLGCHRDDYVGCFPDLNTFYVYNMDNDDDTDCPNGVSGYGENPPVQTVTLLDDNQLKGFYYYNNNIGIPEEYGYYNMLSGLWSDGTPLTIGGNGYNYGSTLTTNYAFPDDPADPEGWSMVTAEMPANDYRILALNSFEYDGEYGISDSTLVPGTIFQYDLAYSFFRKEGLSNLENVAYAKSQIPLLHDYFHIWPPGCDFDKCGCECIWPGDTNKDGAVDYLDVVNIFKHLGETGPARTTPFSWLGVEHLDWQGDFPTILNPKYADVNGDGIVSKRDIELLPDFFGNTNRCYKKKDPVCFEGNELSFELVSGKEPLSANLPYRTNLFLANRDKFWGISYRIEYDPDVFELLSYDDKNEWSDPLIENLYYEKSEEENGILKIIHFNDKKKNMNLSKSNHNQLLSLLLKVKAVPESYPEEFVELKICDVKVYLKDGLSLAIPTQFLKIELPDDVVITSNDDIDDKTIRIFPNPVSDHINIERQQNGPAKIQISDMYGRIVYSGTINSLKESISLEKLNPGTYIFQMITKSGEIFERKLVKMNNGE